MASSLHPCRACQRRLLDAFTSLAGVSTKPPRLSFHLNRASQPITDFQKQRTIHTSSIRWQPHQSREGSILKPDELVLEESAPQQSESQPSTADSSSKTTSTSRSDSSHIPWYLSVAPPTPLSPNSSLPSSIANLELPLPENPPSILEPILTHLSLSIGLDNLALLDLRNLNPPSALGSNLLMILGTARSEKHLNTSADRFCRWLRATYRLRPYADGLLGRNELKLKLRRRNRKMKLAQSVGNTTYDKTEDGITTGWICCNLGAVDVDVSGQRLALEGAGCEEDEEVKELHPIYTAKDQERFLDDEDEYKNPRRDAVEESDFKYRGFGSASDAPRIVVQMFTEGKRLEVDLEGLWESRIKRREEKEERRQAHFETQMDDEFETRRIEDEIERPTVREGDREDRVIAGMGAS